MSGLVETMGNYERQIRWLREHLKQVSSPAKAIAMQRYFPDEVNCFGVKSGDIASVVKAFKASNLDLSADDYLKLAEELLASARFNEEVLVAYALICDLVKKNFDDELLLRFEYWLENYASNWAHVDDLCIKTIYRFLMARPHLIESVREWRSSTVPWCRRASNVAWVKFVRRPMGKKTYFLDKTLIFDNCDHLLADPDMYVQKSIGWLLKVASQHHCNDVLEYVGRNLERMDRMTLRYALEKVDVGVRREILSRPIGM